MVTSLLLSPFQLMHLDLLLIAFQTSQIDDGGLYDGVTIKFCMLSGENRSYPKNLEMLVWG